jgi:1,5-anhydro-D-fructose reductase (1,5-anhydro-D-mannitol-forming)
MQDDRTLALMGCAHVHLDDHLRVLAEEGWRVSHVHDLDEVRGRDFRDGLSAAPLRDPEALPTTGVRGAIVCSETAHHEADIVAALSAGLPVFTEKPLAGSARAALRCADMAEAARLPLHTNYFMRTNAGFARIRSWISTGALGKIVHARMRFSHDGGYADWLDLDAWMTDPALACYGGFADEAVHALDMLQWLLGPVAEGAARTGNALGHRVDDHGAAVLSFETGATGVAEAGWTDTAMRLELDIIGSQAAIRLAEGRADLRPRGTDAPSDSVRLAPLDAGEGLRPFLAALSGETAQGLVQPHEGAAVNALLDAMGLRLGDDAS